MRSLFFILIILMLSCIVAAKGPWRRCIYRGKFYKPGQMLKEKCKTCKCKYNGRVFCKRKWCPLPRCLPNETVVKRHEMCCKACMKGCTESDGTFHPVNTTYSSSTKCFTSCKCEPTSTGGVVEVCRPIQFIQDPCWNSPKECPEGRTKFVPLGACCPACSETIRDCANKSCPTLNCPGGYFRAPDTCCSRCSQVPGKCEKGKKPVRLRGKCCPVCRNFKGCWKVHCPRPPAICQDGSFPTKQPGQCCYECPSSALEVCVHNGQIHNVSETYNDDCDQCTCIVNETVVCTNCQDCHRKLCPEVECKDGRKPVIELGDCCPRCPKPMCLYNGKLYNVSEIFRDGCNVCACMADLTVVCAKRNCQDCSSVLCPIPPAKCPDESVPFKSPGQCCYECPEQSSGCVYNGTAYNASDTFKNDCNTCTCLVNGSVTCTRMKCKGRCPSVPRGISGICVEECSEDDDCPGEQKCCSNGCGHVCRDPVTGPDCSSVVCVKPDCLPGNPTYTPAGKCCPLCKRGCSKNGVFYDPNDKMPSSGPCEHCTCADKGNGTYSEQCFIQGCPNPGPCYERPEGVCCARPVPCWCIYKGKTYEAGETFKDDCNECTCSEIRSVLCTKKNCTVRCPSFPRGISGICVEECSEDDDCPEEQMCCFNGCGHVCMDPVTGPDCSSVVCVKPDCLPGIPTYTPAGKCCPICKMGCSKDGVFYDPNDKMPSSGPCEHCTCANKGNGTYSEQCFIQDCPNPGPCYERPEGVCCATPVPCTCIHDGKTYNVGDTFKDDCNNCICPKVPPGTSGMCVQMCSADDECPEKQKCCSNGCGHVCRDPVSRPDIGGQPS
ncbi:unnamed protein product [Owenia fusiformis]|uniref:Kielin/chordin-like protein n=1 Tax=Owenia fusiformis TaxID=6347 RepID=A0A8S4Q0J5_OWEFU|nr:unnamed protein product [Owenia fusiformis]